MISRRFDCLLAVSVSAIGLLVAAAWARPAGLLSAASADQIVSWSLDPGTELVLLEDHRVPLIFLVIEVPLGTWSEWVIENQAEQAFELQMLDPGSRLAARADRLGIELDLKMDAWSSRLTVTCLRQDLEAVIELVGDIIDNRELDQRELRRLRKERALTWSASEKNPHFVLAQGVARLLLTTSDPRRQRWEKPVKLMTDTERLTTVRDRLMRAPGRVIALAGDIDRATAEQAATRLLPPLSPEPVAGREPAFDRLATRLETAHDSSLPMKRLNQVYFAYVRDSLSYQDPDWPAFMVADHVLGGHFFSRLNVALRHEGGETYGAQTINRGGVARHAYLLTTYTRAENAAVGEDKLRAVLHRFHEQGITEEERQAAIGFLAGRRLFYRQSPEQILRRYLDERRHGFAPGFHDRLVDQAAELSLDQVNAFIKTFYDPAAFTMVRVVPAR